MLTDERIKELAAEVVSRYPGIRGNMAAELRDDILVAIKLAVAERTKEAAALVDGWHISKGGYGNLAEAIRALS